MRGISLATFIGILAFMAPNAMAAGQHWYIISYLDGAVGFDLESIDTYGRKGINVTVGGYSPEAIETQSGVDAYFFVEAVQFDCDGNINVRASMLFDANHTRVEEERDMADNWRSTRPSSIYLAINAAVCENYALRNAREAYSLEEAFNVMKAVTK